MGGHGKRSSSHNSIQHSNIDTSVKQQEYNNNFVSKQALENLVRLSSMYSPLQQKQQINMNIYNKNKNSNKPEQQPELQHFINDYQNYRNIKSSSYADQNLHDPSLSLAWNNGNINYYHHHRHQDKNKINLKRDNAIMQPKQQQQLLLTKEQNSPIQQTYHQLNMPLNRKSNNDNFETISTSSIAVKNMINSYNKKQQQQNTATLSSLPVYSYSSSNSFPSSPSTLSLTSYTSTLPFSNPSFFEQPSVSGDFDYKDDLIYNEGENFENELNNIFVNGVRDKKIKAKRSVPQITTSAEEWANKRIKLPTNIITATINNGKTTSITSKITSIITTAAPNINNSNMIKPIPSPIKS